MSEPLTRQRHASSPHTSHLTRTPTVPAPETDARPILRSADQLRGYRLLAYDPATPINRDYEARLFDFYGRPEYW